MTDSGKGLGARVRLFRTAIGRHTPIHPRSVRLSIEDASSNVSAPIWWIRHRREPRCCSRLACQRKSHVHQHPVYIYAHRPSEQVQHLDLNTQNVSLSGAEIQRLSVKRLQKQENLQRAREETRKISSSLCSSPQSSLQPTRRHEPSWKSIANMRSQKVDLRYSAASQRSMSANFLSTKTFQQTPNTHCTRGWVQDISKH